MNKKIYFTHKIIFLEKVSNSEIEQSDWQEKLSIFAHVRPLHDHSLYYVENIEKFELAISKDYLLFKIRFDFRIYENEQVNNMRIVYGKNLFEIKKISNHQEQKKIINIIGLKI